MTARSLCCPTETSLDGGTCLTSTSLERSMAAKDETPRPKPAARATRPATTAKQPEGNKAPPDQRPQETETGAPVVGPSSGPDAGEPARAKTALGELLGAFG